MIFKKKREEERAASQKKREEDIAAEIEYENAFQIYLKNLSDLLLNHNLLNSSEGDIVRSLAFTRTKTTVRVLDGERRGRVIRFLYDTSLINTDKQIIRTDDLDLYGANMIGFHFKNANLSNTFLDNSDFRGAVMGNVDFTNSTLKKAILRDAKFETAVLKGINLEGASYDGRTKWPTDFNPKEYKAINSDEIRRS
ncbi:MAG: pentapeptide repeat-containing protein [Segetibacter sp.]